MSHYLNDILRQDHPTLHRQSVGEVKRMVGILLQMGTFSQLETAQAFFHAFMLGYVTLDATTIESFGQMLLQMDRSLTTTVEELRKQIDAQDKQADPDTTCAECERCIPADHYRCVECQRIIDAAIRQDIQAMAQAMQADSQED